MTEFITEYEGLPLVYNPNYKSKDYKQVDQSVKSAFKTDVYSVSQGAGKIEIRKDFISGNLNTNEIITTLERIAKQNNRLCVSKEVKDLWVRFELI